MSKDSTRQRDILLSYLEAHADEQMSIQKIASDLEEQKVSSSAVYRNLFELEKENRVKRCIRDNSRAVSYTHLQMVMQLKEVNGLDDINKIYIGQELTLP